MGLLLTVSSLPLAADRHQRIVGLLAIAFAIVIAMEFTTPTEYVFGYLYTGPILLASARLNRRAALWVTLAAVGLTLLNLVVPNLVWGELPLVANRAIAVLALMVTGWLSDRNHRYRGAIAQQQAQLQAQAQLAEIRENFVATLTHDLKTPLLGALQTLKSFQAGQFGEVTSAQKNVLAVMERSQRSTLQLVETLLDVYRNDAEGLELHREPFDLLALTEGAIATLSDLAAVRRTHIRLNPTDSDFRQQPIIVEGDSLQLERVLTNLIINGINHAPRGSAIEVFLDSRTTKARIKVSDSGPGISDLELPHLFDRFYQGTADRQAKGAGLGLYLSRQIVEAHSGKIWAENREPQGATFGVELPRSLPAGR